MPTYITDILNKDAGATPISFIYQPNNLGDGLPQQPVQPTQTGPCPPLSNWGFAQGETPINYNGYSVKDFFSQPHVPDLQFIQTDGYQREEGARRISIAEGVEYIFVNTGYILPSNCLIDAYIGRIGIPYTSIITFINHYFPEYNERLYIGTDNYLYRLEKKSYGPPPPPPPGTTLGSGKIFFPINDGDVIQNTDYITYGMWSESVGNLLNFFTSSIALQGTGSRLYNLEVRNYIDTNCKSEVQFNIAYGHLGGSGSNDLGGYDYLTPTKAIYGQYRQLCLEASQSKFRIDQEVLNSIYVINVKRSKFGDSMDEGNWELNLHHLSGSQFVATHPRNAYTGSNVKVGVPGKITRLIDDSKLNYPTLGSVGEIYNIVSGSIEQGVYNPTNPVKFGLFYPKIGTLVLNGNKLDSVCNFLTVTGSDVNGTNYVQLFKSISGSAKYTDASGDRLGFQARKLKMVNNTTYYIRVKNQDFNFSNNPSYVTGSEGMILNDFRGNPRTYITTVGLYNNRKELLAIGKLSKPISKTFTEEALFKMKLKFG